MIHDSLLQPHSDARNRLHCRRTSTKLEQTKQAQRIQAVLCLLQDATELANKGSEESLSIGDRLDAQVETSRMLLDSFKA
jgi:hypothetical protein